MVTTRRNSDDDVPNFEAMINAAVANALPNFTAALRTQITNDIRNGAESSGGSGGGGDAIPHGIHVWIERFTKLKPLAFRSAATPAEAEDWITHMEKLFQVLGCPDNFKTRLAAFKLESDALSWWKAHLRTQIDYNRYFTASEQQRYEREYGSIYQLDRENSGEYMKRFTRLASFVGTAAGDAQRQARHFKWGLKKWVLDRIINTDYTNVAQVAAAARNIELLHESGNSNKRDRDGNRIQNRGHGQQENKGHHDQGQHEYRGRQDQSVEHQGRQDWGYDSKRQDFWGQDQRFDGRNGNDCPGRVYTTTRDQAAKTSGTITGNLYIDDHTVFVLFDTGATHSIISTTFAKKLNMTPTPLMKPSAPNMLKIFCCSLNSLMNFRDELPGLPPAREIQICNELIPDIVVAPILTLPSGSGGFQIYSDASKKGLGCVLMQHWKVIAYASDSFEYLMKHFEKVLTEAHSAPFTFTRFNQKYRDLKKNFKVVNYMKQDVLQLAIPNSSCIRIVVCRTTQKRHMQFEGGLFDRLTNLLILYHSEELCNSRVGEIFQQEIVRLHGHRLLFVSDRDPKFTSHIWKDYRRLRGTRAKFSTRQFILKLMELNSFGQAKPQSSIHGRLSILERNGEVSYRLALPPYLNMSLSGNPESITGSQERVMKTKFIPLLHLRYKDILRVVEVWEFILQGHLKSKKQNTLSKSSTDAEHRALASITSGVIWILKILKEKVLKGVLKTIKVDSANQITDILTKELDTVQHLELIKRLGFKKGLADFEQRLKDEGLLLPRVD
ncbi:zinc finger, CCHC-type, retrotransposon gag domain protein [Tanacetum coccineum]